MKFSLILTSFFLVLPTVIYAQGKVYSPLVDLSNAGQGNEVQSFEQYINFLYGMSIAVAALLAVIKIIIAGTKYMLSDVIGSKESAKTDIQGAILGLLLIISAVVILELINPKLTDNKIKFDPLTGRVALPSPSLTTAGGQTNEQFADGLSQNLDDCVLVGTSKTTVDGATTRVTADFNNCEPAELEVKQKEIFQNNCNQSAGNIISGGRGSGVAICSTFNQDAILPAQLAAAKGELAYFKKTFLPNTDGDGDGKVDFHNQTIPDEYIRLDGATIVVDVKRFCDDSYTSSSFSGLTNTQKVAAVADCTRTQGGGWTGRMTSRCVVNDVRGKAFYTSGVFKCQMPKQVQPGNKLRYTTTLNGQTTTVDATTWEQATSACGKGNSLIKTRGPGAQFADGFLGGLTLSDYDCFRY